MNINGDINGSVANLRLVLETSPVIGSMFSSSASVCVQKTSLTLLASRFDAYKHRHSMGSTETTETRLRNVKKEMQMHAEAFYSAWAALPALNNEYLAIIEGVAHKKSEADRREAAALSRAERKFRHAQEDRAASLLELQKKLRASEDLGVVGGPEDLADQQQDKKADQEAQLHRHRAQLRHQIFSNFTAEMAISLLMMVDVLPPEEVQKHLQVTMKAMAEQGKKKIFKRR